MVMWDGSRLPTLRKSNKISTPCFIGVLFCFLCSIIVGCESEYSTPSSLSALSFSADTLSFDSLFVGDQSENLVLRLYNRSKDNVLIDQILLEGGENAHFSINIDGVSSPSLMNVQLAAKDSLFIFVNFFCNHTMLENSMEVTDRITLRVGSMTKSAILSAHVMNVNVLDNVTISRNTSLTSNIPYRIYGELNIPEGTTLTIAPSAELYMAPKSRIEVYGNLIAEGTMDEPITIHSDRLSSFYDDVPSQWDWICINKSAHASLKNVEISNARNAIQVDSTASLWLNSCILRDAGASMVYSNHGDIHVYNSLMYNSGGALLEAHGGDVECIHSTLSNHFSWDYRKVSAVRLLPSTDSSYGNLLLANSIIEGNQRNELECEAESLLVDHCAITTENIKSIANDSRFVEVISTGNIKFKDVKKHNYHLTEGSDALNKANPSYVNDCPVDLDGNSRNISTPTIGAYECPIEQQIADHEK